jgi:hypothetical protein
LSFSFLIVACVSGIYKTALVYHQKWQQNARLGWMVKANGVVCIEREFTVISASEVCKIPLARKWYSSCKPSKDKWINWRKWVKRIQMRRHTRGTNPEI